MGGGIGMGNTCKPMAVLFQCMTKFTTNKKKKKKRTSHTGLLLFQNRLALLKCLSFSTCESLSHDSGYCLHADLLVGQCAPRAGGTVGDAFLNLTVWPNSLNSGFSINESWC